MRASVFSGIKESLNEIHESVYIMEIYIMASVSDSCRDVSVLAKEVSRVNALSTSIMTIANILNIQTDKETVDLINKCKVILEDIHEMCKVAYLKDEYKGYELITVSSDIGETIKKYSKSKTKDEEYVLQGSKVKILISDNLEGMDVIIGGEVNARS